MEALEATEEDTVAAVEAGEADCVEKDMILSCKSFLVTISAFITNWLFLVLV